MTSGANSEANKPKTTAETIALLLKRRHPDLKLKSGNKELPPNSHIITFVGTVGTEKVEDKSNG